MAAKSKTACAIGVPITSMRLRSRVPSPDLFGQLQSAVATFERRGAAVGHRVETHQRHAHGISGHRDSFRRRSRRGSGLQVLADPRTLAAGHGLDAFHNRQVNGPRGNQVHDGTRHAVSVLPGRGRVFLRTARSSRADDCRSGPWYRPPLGITEGSSTPAPVP